MKMENKRKNKDSFKKIEEEIKEEIVDILKEEEKVSLDEALEAKRKELEEKVEEEIKTTTYYNTWLQYAYARHTGLPVGYVQKGNVEVIEIDGDAAFILQNGLEVEIESRFLEEIK